MRSTRDKDSHLLWLRLLSLAKQAGATWQTGVSPCLQKDGVVRKAQDIPISSFHLVITHYLTFT